MYKIQRARNSGFIGLLALFIVVALVIYFSVIQYQKFAIGIKDETKDKTYGSNDSSRLSPIDRAKEAKQMIENNNRGTFLQ